MIHILFSGTLNTTQSSTAIRIPATSELCQRRSFCVVSWWWGSATLEAGTPGKLRPHGETNRQIRRRL